MTNQAPIQDTLFFMMHAADIERLAEWNPKAVHQLVSSAAGFADRHLADIEPGLDASPPMLVDGRVVVAQPLRDFFQSFVSEGWLQRCVVDRRKQGAGLLSTAVLFEMMSVHSQNASAAITSLVAGANLLAAAPEGPLKSRCLPMLLEGNAGCSILVCEADAGSDLRRIETHARAIDDDTWQLEGTKTFITNGDHNLAPAHLYFVLAHTENLPKSFKGMSLFLCQVNDNDRERGIRVAQLNEKLGLRAVPSCELVIDGAVGELVGDAGEGLRQMGGLFSLMTGMVSAQSLGIMEAARQHSLSYARLRKQGRAVDSSGSTVDPAPIEMHADVKRMLLTQDALVCGARALLYYAVVGLNVDPGDSLSRMLLTLSKILTTEAAFSLADVAVQVHGRLGYLQSHPASRLLRDSRGARLYEGTTGILSSQFAQMIASPNGETAAAAFCAHIEREAEANATDAARLAEFKRVWEQSCAQVRVAADPTVLADSFTRIACLVALSVSWSRIQRGLEHAPDSQRLGRAGDFFWSQLAPEVHFRAAQMRGVRE